MSAKMEKIVKMCYSLQQDVKAPYEEFITLEVVLFLLNKLPTKILKVEDGKIVWGVDVTVNLNCVPEDYFGDRKQQRLEQFRNKLKDLRLSH